MVSGVLRFSDLILRMSCKFPSLEADPGQRYQPGRGLSTVTVNVLPGKSGAQAALVFRTRLRMCRECAFPRGAAPPGSCAQGLRRRKLPPRSVPSFLPERLVGYPPLGQTFIFLHPLHRITCALPCFRCTEMIAMIADIPGITILPDNPAPVRFIRVETASPEGHQFLLFLSVSHAITRFPMLR